MKAEGSRAYFVEWAKESLTTLRSVAPGCGFEDLVPLGRMIGDAVVVALGEGDHFGAEPMLFRNRLLEYLVEEKGFTAIALESGIVEGRVVHDYVCDGTGDLSQVLSQGITWTFDQLPQNEALIRWMREYNADPRHTRKVSFYGFDVPGSPSNAEARRGVDTALVEVLQYLDRVDPEAGETFHARVDYFLPNLRFDLWRPPNGPGYHSFNQAERDALTAAVADLLALLERRETRYTIASSAHDYTWAYRAVLSARQVDGWLRHIPPEWRASGEQLRFLDTASDLRDRAQADNLDWIVRREGPLGKVLIYAHNGHLSTTPVRWNWWPLDRAGQLREEPSDSYTHETAGVYLRRRFGDQLFTIGNLIGQGSIGTASFTQTFEPPVADSLDGTAKEVGVPLFLLDLRTATSGATHWLHSERRLGRGVDLPPHYKVSLEIPLGRAFDAVFYLDTVSPACHRKG